jgi:hypothetical protein
VVGAGNPIEKAGATMRHCAADEAAVGEVGSPLEHVDSPRSCSANFVTDLGNEVRNWGFDVTHSATPIRAA